MARYPVDRADSGLAAVVLAGKLFLHPVLVLLAMMLMAGTPPDLAWVAVLFAAMPMVSIFPILGEPFGIDRLCATTLIAAVTISFATIALWAALGGL